MFTKKDLEFIERNGLTLNDIESQLHIFSRGIPPLDIIGPAVPGNGIVCLDKAEQEELVDRYELWNGSRIKFVPASGAASRMFKDLFTAAGMLRDNEKAELPEAAHTFFKHLREFAFYPQLSRLRGFDPDSPGRVLTLLLEDEWLNYGSLPKGLIPFHKYPEGPRTPFGEHLVESALCDTPAGDTVNVHFTVSPEHESLFAGLLEITRGDFEKRFGMTLNVSFSTQSPSTNTVAVDMQNRPFRSRDGSLVLRPGGHGALLENLNTLTQDMVFIRNIDNVVPEALLDPVIHWRRVLGGYLLRCRRQVYKYIGELKDHAAPLRLREMADFLEQTFGITHPPMEGEEFRSYLFSKLNRPVRVCGMVRSTGEPGGGPFRVKDKDGSGSMQILESVQLNGKKFNATHFNPVDIVCSFKDYDGKVYHLPDFRDDDTGFISHKSLEGRELKALELPGLWNGSMSGWNTAFVEVPLSTFNPVKTINDLLRKEHNI
ncbi:MAG TPA: DUF4301 family protein [Bacteroidales bacterium]|nr:DUF4301 family protein [Bacteroidales bacterium]